MIKWTTFEDYPGYEFSNKWHIRYKGTNQLFKNDSLVTMVDKYNVKRCVNTKAVIIEQLLGCRIEPRNYIVRSIITDSMIRIIEIKENGEHYQYALNTDQAANILKAATSLKALNQRIYNSLTYGTKIDKRFEISQVYKSLGSLLKCNI